MQELMKNKNYCYLMMSDIVNRFGDAIDAIVFSWLAYSLTKNASFSVLVYALNRIPTVILMPFVGAFIENQKKHKIMIISDLVRAVLVGYVVIRIWNGTFVSYELLMITFLISCAETFRQPASKCMIPLIVSKEKLDEAISYNTSFSTMAELIGTACAAMIIGWIGNTGAMCIDILTFLLSALFLSLLKIDEKYDDAKRNDLKEELREGLHVVKENHVISYLLLVSLFLNGLFVPYNSLEASFVGEVLQGNEAVLSLSGMASGIGMIIGSSLYPKISSKVSKRSILMTASIMLTSVYLCSFGISFLDLYEIRVVLFVLLMFIVSLSLGMHSVCTQVLIISYCDAKYLARVSSLMIALSQACSPVLSLLVSFLVRYISIGHLFLLSGICMIIGDVLIFRKRVMPHELQK